MSFKTLSFNVIQLNGIDSIRVLRNYIEKILQLDLLCIQEHKLCLVEASNMGRYLWHGSKVWICDASPRYNNIVDDQDVGCSGIALLLAKCWSNLDTKYGTVMGSRG